MSVKPAYKVLTVDTFGRQGLKACFTASEALACFREAFESDTQMVTVLDEDGFVLDEFDLDDLVFSEAPSAHYGVIQDDEPFLHLV